ncbi:MAG: hypothetical protein ACRDK4_15035 [Solirubrobacteraceae bacterium]
MPISAHTRKVLWGLASNACARCGVALVRTPIAAGDPHAVIGQECHITAQAPGGPRGQLGSRDDLDGYDNLILLCANCHVAADAQPDNFPPEILRQIKRDHERRVAVRGTPTTPEFTVRGRDKAVRLELIESGDRLLSICAHAFSWAYEKPTSLSSAQRELIGDFLQACRDWGEIHDEIGPKGQLDAGEMLQYQLGGLRDEGLVVYASRRRLTLKVEDSESPWPEAFVKVMHERDAPRENASQAAPLCEQEPSACH